MTHNTRKIIEEFSITEYRAQMLREMKEALQNNLPFAVDTGFTSFMRAFEKMIDGYADKIQQSHHQELQKAREVTEDTSDGYHTFKELYEFRLLYNAHLFNEWAKQGMYDVHKSTKHSDGEDCFGGGWFIVVASLPSGDISNHYEMKDWDLFQCHIRQTAKEWDGHTSQDVAKRLRDLLEQSELDQPNK